MKNILALSLLGIATGCATADSVQQLSEEVKSLKAEVESLKSTKPSAAAPADAAAAAAAKTADGASEEDEAAARTLFTDASNLVQQGDYDQAKAKLAEMKSKYPTARTTRRAQKLEAELEVIGKPAPATLEVEEWLQGQGEVSLANGKPTLLVFWEVWCPHCKREVPELQATYEELKPKGLQMVGLTKLSRNKSKEEVMGFIKDKGVTYPIAKEGGAVSSIFNVSGIPAAAIVKDGKIIWRGHPARLDKAMLEGLL